MMIFKIFRMALGALSTNLFRSLLATLGVMIGVGAVISAVSILEGSQRDVLETLESFGADQVIVFNGQSNRGGRNSAINSLEMKDITALEQNNEFIKAAAPQYQNGAQVKYFQKNINCIVLGTNHKYNTINKYKVKRGRFLTEQDVSSQNMAAVLGSQAAEDLFGSLPAVGKTVKIAGKTFKIVGVMEERGSVGFSNVDNQVIIPVTTAMIRLFGAKYLSMIIVQATNAKKLDQTIAAVEQTLRTSHRLSPEDEDDFQIYTQNRFKEQFGRFALLFAVVLYSIAGISMIVGGIGIMNIMMVSVTERTREIGVRIAVGARKMDILKQFLIEAAFISFLGGGLGVVVGWALSNLLKDITGDLLKVHTPIESIFAALIMATMTGIISGIYPAIRASKLDPVQALRFE